jgi:hypothetical protein
MSLLICLQRIADVDEPLGTDMPPYSVIAHELLQGEQLYADVVDVKPPGLYATYALAELAFGRELHAFGLGMLCAAAFWTAVNGALAIQANPPNTEAFMNVACFGAWRRYALAGLLLGIGSTFKPLPVLPAAALPWAVVFVHAAATERLGLTWIANVSMNAGRSGGALFNAYRYLREGRVRPARGA